MKAWVRTVDTDKKISLPPPMPLEQADRNAAVQRAGTMRQEAGTFAATQLNATQNGTLRIR